MQEIQVYFINYNSIQETDYTCLFPVLYQSRIRCEVTFADMLNMYIVGFAQDIVCFSMIDRWVA